MSAQILNIQTKHKKHPFSIVSLSDFQYVEGDMMDAKTIIDNPNISLYCIDDQHKRAIFVETTSDIIALANAPFFYQAQFEHAQRLIAVDYEELHRLARDIVEQSENSAINFYSVRWLSFMQSYLSLFRQDIPMCALRYEDLVANPQEMLKAIFQYCDLPISEVSNACRAFEDDSQVGSKVPRDNTRKTDIKKQDILEIREHVRKFLKTHPEIQSPDFIVPGTLKLDTRS